MVNESGAHTLFHGLMTGVETSGDTVVSVVCNTISSMVKIKAKRFIDATGDAHLAAFAGVPFECGDDEGGPCQPMTTSFNLADVDYAKFNKKAANALYAEYKAAGKITNPIAKEAVLKTCVLLKNDGILPFDRHKIYDLRRRRIQASQIQGFYRSLFVRCGYARTKRAKGYGMENSIRRILYHTISRLYTRTFSKFIGCREMYRQYPYRASLFSNYARRQLYRRGCGNCRCDR